MAPVTPRILAAPAELRPVASPDSAPPLTLLPRLGPASRPARPASAPVVFHDGQMLLPVNHATEAVRAAVYHAQDDDAWTDSDGESVPTFAFSTNKDKGMVFVSVRPDGPFTLTPDLRATLRQQVRDLDDLTLDVLEICLARWWAEGGDGDVWVSVRAILDAREREPIRRGDDGRKAHHGHRPKDKLAVFQALARLDTIWLDLRDVQVTGATGSQKGKRLTLLSRLLGVRDFLFEAGGRVPYAARIAPGGWANAYRELGVLTLGPLPRQALHYDPYHETIPKRLGKYLAAQFRINRRARQGEPLRRRIRLLFERNGLPLDERNPKRTKERFERALDRLQKDGLIGDWHYTSDPDEVCPLRQWLPAWLNLSVEVLPPS